MLPKNKQTKNKTKNCSVTLSYHQLTLVKYLKFYTVSQETTQFCSDWLFFEKKSEKSTQILYFLGDLKKKKFWWIVNPTFQEIPLESNITIFLS